jgi:hypothetical protein
MDAASEAVTAERLHGKIVSVIGSCRTPEQVRNATRWGKSVLYKLLEPSLAREVSIDVLRSGIDRLDDMAGRPRDPFLRGGEWR